MTSNRDLSRRVFEEVWNQHNIDAIDELMAGNYVHHDPNSPPANGPAAYKELVRAYLAAFPDGRFTLHEEISDGDTVVTRWTITGTHSGELNGTPATGRRFEVTGMTLAHVHDGKFVESWSNWDALGLMQQLGVVAQKESTKGRAA